MASYAIDAGSTPAPAIMGKEKPKLTVREAARQRQPLDGVDAQALEAALTQTELQLTIAEDKVAMLKSRLAVLESKLFTLREVVEGHNTGRKN